MFKDVIEAMMLITQNKRSKKINTDNIIKLLKLLETDIHSLVEFKITNKYINDNNLYNQMLTISNENRADNKKLLKTESNRQDTANFIRDANEILSKVGIELKMNKELTKKISLPNKSRYNLNTYEISSKYKKEFKYNDMNINVSTMDILNHLKKSETIDFINDD